MADKTVTVDNTRPFDVLRRFARRGERHTDGRSGQHSDQHLIHHSDQHSNTYEAERCDMCGERLRTDHRHILNLKSREILCACQACVLLLDSPSAGGGTRRLIPNRVRRLTASEFVMSDLQWAALQIPVRMAFLCCRSDIALAAAFYPSPMGLTEASLPLAAWDELRSENSVLEEMEPDVEALLIDRRDGRGDVFLAPIDLCYQLTGIVRSNWKGMSGGSLVHMEIDRFFTELDERAVRLGANYART